MNNIWETKQNSAMCVWSIQLRDLWWPLEVVSAILTDHSLFRYTHIFQTSIKCHSVNCSTRYVSAINCLWLLRVRLPRLSKMNEGIKNSYQFCLQQKLWVQMGIANTTHSFSSTIILPNVKRFVSMICGLLAYGLWRLTNVLLSFGHVACL